jgi:hypothetical protein
MNKNARVEIKEFAEKIKSDSKLSSLLDEIWKGNHVLTMCLDCGKVFVNMPMKDFVFRDAGNNGASPGKWFLDAAIHFCENPNHRILGYSSSNPAYNFSSAWLVAIKRAGISIKTYHEAVVKLRKKAEYKLI